ncbi:ankyrin repeat domain-containing protein 49-like [Agrilus planipennis]|uniref:Ankyrin repeat domain-containing protein 49-like n=1 Tax=Agrilus planipennis TaxID=224129 RepID=A0A1W4WWF3_AGRPL|nr:ankyrin repeat domain-containing protein 49-like [Agrilus planipennis]
MPNDERFLVSGWEDDLNDIDYEKHPHETPEKEILWAAENGELEVVKSLVLKDPGLVNVADKDGYTPLHRACYNNHVEVVEFLLENGADISAKTLMLWQPLHSACQWNHKECVLRLIQHGADVNAASEGGQTPLHIATSHGTSYESVQLLLMHPYINPNILNNNKETPFDIAKRASNYYKMFEMTNPAFNGIRKTTGNIK